MSDNHLANNFPNTTDHSSPPPTVMAAIFLVGMFAFLQVYSIQAILPVLKQTLHASASQVGISVGMTVIAIALVSPFMGMISDLLGRKRFVVGAMILLAIPTFMVSLADHIYKLNLWRFLQGLCVPAMTVVILAYLSEEFPQAVAKLTSIYVAGTVLGGFLGRFILGHLHSLVGYQKGFVIMAAATLLGAVIVQFLLPTSRHFVASDNLRQGLATLKSHSKNPAVIASCVLGGCVLFSLVACFTFINLHLDRPPYNLSSSALANIFAVYLIGVVITPLSTKIITRFGTQKTLVMAILLSALGLLLSLAAPLWVIIVGLTIMSSGVFITQTATISFMTAHLKHGRSLGLGLYYMTYYAGGSLGAWLGGIAFGYGAWLSVVLLIFGVQAMGLITIRQMGRFNQSAQSV